MNAPAEDPRAKAAFLTDAFSDFTFAASRLEESYQELKKEVTQLRAILAQRNQALHSSLAENVQMRMALRHIVDSLPCGVLVVEDNRFITLVNREAKRLLEITCERVTTVDDIPSTSRVPLTTVLEPSYAHSAEEEFCVVTSSMKRWLAVRSRTLCGAADSPRTAALTVRQPQQTILIVRETTGQKKLEEEREAARNVVALAEMASVLAHEIRNPLASLELFAGLLSDQNNNEDTSEYISHLRAGIRSLSATVNNVLRSHSAGSLHFGRVHLGNSLRSAVEFVRPLADQKHIGCSLEECLGDLVISGDENAIQQVVLNLASNAFRHTPPGGRLHISASPLDSASGLRAQIKFSDNGCGIAPESLPRIFERGFSGNNQTPGLGLAVCQKIVEQHGGLIRATSLPGQGSTFHLEFPAAR